MYKLGIDLGGTNIVAGVIDENFKMVGVAKTKTASPRPAEAIVDDMARITFEAIENAGISIDDIDGFGIGAPGTVDTETGIIYYSNNLGFKDVPLKQLMLERTGKEFHIANDANAAAYGEYIAGAGKGTNTFVAITLGTGVGSGIIIDGKIFSGSSCAGGELGHTVIQMNGEQCTCGRFGCFEAYASATALIRQTKQAMVRYSDSIMWQLCDNDISKVNGITAFNAMRNNDVAGKMVVDQYIYYLSIGISNVVNAFQPDIICLGGGISKEGDYLTKPLERIVNGENYARGLKTHTVIKTADLGNDAGIIGAAYLCDIYK